MNFKNMKIGQKLVLSFTVVLSIFVFVAVNQVFNMGSLGDLQDEGAGRAADALTIIEIDMLLDESYSVIADAIINENIAASKEEFGKIKARAAADIRTVLELADTEQEKKDAEEFRIIYTKYLDKFEKELLPLLESKSSVAKRAKDALIIKDISQHVDHVYAIIANAIISRNAREARAKFTKVKKEAEKDMDTVMKLVDTEAERAWALEFKVKYREYLATFENRILPYLASGGSDMTRLRAMNEQIDKQRDATVTVLMKINKSLEEEEKEAAADEKKVRELDGEIDKLREQAAVPLDRMVESLKGENKEADQVFDDTRASTVRLSIILIVAGLMLAALLVFLITRSFTTPINKLVEVSDKVARGDVSVDIEVNREDEIGHLLKSNRNMTGILRGVVEDVEKLANAARDGRLSYRGDESKYSGSFAGIIDGINNTLDNVVRPLEIASDNMEAISKGKIPEPIEEEFRGDYNRIKTSLNRMIANLSEIVNDIKNASGQVAAGSQEMSSSAEQLSQGATEQASAAEQVSSSIEQMTATIQQNADNAEETEKISMKTAQDAETSGEAVTSAVDAMKQIADKITVIQEIARQTNLLALNASIEAARAGEHGKGFAVVASEVGKLANRSQNAAAEITELANSSVNIAESAGNMLAQLVPDIRKTAELVQEISAASNEQRSGADQINKAVMQLDQVIQQNAQSSEQFSSTAEELSAQAEQLQSSINFFKLKDNRPGFRRNEREQELIRRQLPGKTLHLGPGKPENENPAGGAKQEKGNGVHLDLDREGVQDAEDNDFEKY